MCRSLKMTDPILSHKLKRGEDEKLEAFDGRNGSWFSTGSNPDSERNIKVLGRDEELLNVEMEIILCRLMDVRNKKR